MHESENIASNLFTEYKWLPDYSRISAESARGVYTLSLHDALPICAGRQRGLMVTVAALQ